MYAIRSYYGIGWIGTGVMGGPMCGHIMDKGYSMTVNTRAKDKAKLLLKKGAAWADSPRRNNFV